MTKVIAIMQRLQIKKCVYSRNLHNIHIRVVRFKLELTIILSNVHQFAAS